MTGRKAAAIGAVFFAAFMACGACRVGGRQSAPPDGPLVEGWADATNVFVMDIPAACPAQRLEYAGWRKAATGPASVEFVVSQMDREVLATGSDDFADYTDGAADWTLPADEVYALTVRGVNARWRFVVRCR